MRTLRAWSAKRRLDQWELAVQDAYPFDEAPVPGSDAELAEEVFELGRFNLYSAMQPAETYQEYQRVRAVFAGAGLSTLPSSRFDFTRWD